MLIRRVRFFPIVYGPIGKYDLARSVIPGLKIIGHPHFFRLPEDLTDLCLGHSYAKIRPQLDLSCQSICPGKGAADMCDDLGVAGRLAKFCAEVPEDLVVSFMFQSGLRNLS